MDFDTEMNDAVEPHELTMKQKTLNRSINKKVMPMVGKAEQECDDVLKNTTLFSKTSRKLKMLLVMWTSGKGIH